MANHRNKQNYRFRTWKFRDRYQVFLTVFCTVVLIKSTLQSKRLYTLSTYKLFRVFLVMLHKCVPWLIVSVTNMAYVHIPLF